MRLLGFEPRSSGPKPERIPSYPTVKCYLLDNPILKSMDVQPQLFNPFYLIYKLFVISSQNSKF